MPLTALTFEFVNSCECMSRETYNSVAPRCTIELATNHCVSESTAIPEKSLLIPMSIRAVCQWSGKHKNNRNIFSNETAKCERKNLVCLGLPPRLDHWQRSVHRPHLFTFGGDPRDTIDVYLVSCTNLTPNRCGLDPRDPCGL